MSEKRTVSRQAGWIALAVGVVTLATVEAAYAQQPGPQLRLDHLARLAEQATNVVDVTLDAAMLQASRNVR